MKKVIFFLLILIFVSGCNNQNEKEEDDSGVIIALKFNSIDDNNVSRAVGDPLILVMLDIWVVGIDDDVITTGINRDTPAASSSSGSIAMVLDSGDIKKIVVRAEYDGGRVYMGYVNAYITRYTTQITVETYETPGSSAIQSFTELDEYIQNNF